MSRVVLLTAAVAIVGANSLVLSPLAGAVAASFPGSDTADILTATAIYGAGTCAAALALAPFADRIGLARALRLALALLAAALAASAAAPDLASLTAAQAAAGLAGGVSLPAIYGLAADLAPKGREAQVLGRVLTGWTLSLVIGVSASAVLADHVHWRAVYVAMAATGLLVTLGLAALENRPGQVRPDMPWRTFLIPGVAAGLATALSFMAAFYGLYAFVGPHVILALGGSTTLAGAVALAYGMGFGLAAALDPLIDRLGAPRAAPLVYGALVLVYVALAATCGGLTQFLAVSVVWGVANHLGLNLIVSTLTAIAPSRRGAILGLFSATTYAAMFAGTLAFRPVFGTQGFACVALISAACVLPAFLRALRSRRNLFST